MAPLLRNEGYRESVHEDKSTITTLRSVAWLLPMALLAPLAAELFERKRQWGPPGHKAIVFLQRTPRGDQGNVFDYTGYAGGGRLVKL